MVTTIECSTRLVQLLSLHWILEGEKRKIQGVLAYLSRPENGGLVLDNQEYYAQFMESCFTSQFSDLDASHYIKGNYVYYFLAAAGIDVVDKNGFYRSQQELNELFNETKSLDEYQELVRERQLREQRLMSIFDWATSSPKHFYDVIMPVWLKEGKSLSHVRQEKNDSGGCPCESCESDPKGKLDIILKSAFFQDFHHVDEEKKQEVTHQSGKSKGRAKQPSHYNREELADQLPFMQATCMIAHRHEHAGGNVIEGTNLRYRVQYNRLKGLHLHQCGGLDIVTGLELPIEFWFLVDYHHLFHDHDHLDDYGTTDKKSKRELSRQVFESPLDFEKAAIKEVMVTIAVDCRVHRLLHFLIKNQKEFIPLGMKPWDFNGNHQTKLPSKPSTSSSNKENENPKKSAKKQRSKK